VTCNGSCRRFRKTPQIGLFLDFPSIRLHGHEASGTTAKDLAHLPVPSFSKESYLSIPFLPYAKSGLLLTLLNNHEHREGPQWLRALPRHGRRTRKAQLEDAQESLSSDSNCHCHEQHSDPKRCGREAECCRSRNRIRRGRGKSNGEETKNSGSYTSPPR
jgi:hypothetical protein